MEEFEIYGPLDICGPLEEFIDRLDQQLAMVIDRRAELERALVEAECSDSDSNEVDLCRAELERVIKEVANVGEAMRWSWRLLGFVNGTRGTVPPPKMLRALEAQSEAVTQVSRGKPNSKSSRACARIEAALREHGPLHRRRLLEILLADGVLGAEARPINRLATILTENRHLFSSDGRGTYTLAAAGHTEQRRVTVPSSLSGPQQSARSARKLVHGGDSHAVT
ncbi:hypothetical protein [Pseudoroseomonas ludipueritiae]|uniref:HTH HARE-type domain-containing protein n=1 Tax=Pseudoroseomonas ludipueritiae TaxID=198093 RepID=A0ABR7RB66_9PROT|nr:hypothetical protein [Pseudoroseomonas ludipueritiae]MBC9179077.1 hypothetical protein [Pseudoroseomonas ludipueritiae]